MKVLRTLPAQQSNRSGQCKTLLTLLLNSLASIQIVWVYLLHTRGALNLTAFENGTERTPFQYRLLMAFPLRWAHHSSPIIAAAEALQRMHGWFPAHVSAEGLVQFVSALLCVAIPGIVAGRLYQATTHTRILTPFIYPLTLVLIAFSYVLLTTHDLRFIYDFPALAFFSIGLYLIYFRHRAWFILLFVVATLNRETALLLLPLYAASQCLGLSERTALQTAPPSAPATIRWRNLYAPRTIIVILPLVVFWIGWHLWVFHRFAANRSAAGPRLLLNLGLLLCPFSWPQSASACGFLWPIIFVYRSRIGDPTLRLWIWLLPAWFGFMLMFGLLIEPRIFGELIPLVACTSALIAEETILCQAEIATTPRVLPLKVRRTS